MISLWRKKRFKFSVDLMVADLCDVPLVSNNLFAKIRLLEGGSYVSQTRTVAVSAHRVCWSQEFTFSVRIASDETGYLQRTFVRVSVRKETKGGKTFDKLGFVDVDLASFAGSGSEGRQQSFLLEGYRPTARLDNSRLRLNVAMHLLSSDPLFKVPRPIAASTSAQEELNPRDLKAPGSSPALAQQSSEASVDAHSLASLASSSGFGSVSRETQAQPLPPPCCHDDCASELGSIPGHSRNASSTSQSSGPLPAHHPSCPNHPVHSRQSSVDGPRGLLSVGTGVELRPNRSSAVSPGLNPAAFAPAHDRRPSSDIGKYGSVGSAAGGKMASSRVDAENVIEDLLKDKLLPEMGEGGRLGEADGKGSGGGLALFVGPDGTPAVGSDDMRPVASFVKVILPEST